MFLPRYECFDDFAHVADAAFNRQSWPGAAPRNAHALYPFSLATACSGSPSSSSTRCSGSARILEERRRNLVERRVTREQADRLIAAMRGAFEEAEVDPTEIKRLEPAMTTS